MRAARVASVPAVVVGVLAISLECFGVGATVSTAWPGDVQGGHVNTAAGRAENADKSGAASHTARSAGRPSAHARTSGTTVLSGVVRV